MRGAAAALALALLVACGPANDVVVDSLANRQRITMLDGDTLRVGDETVHVAGIDAPELPPWSECWAEAALAGSSKQAAEGLVEGNVGSRSWRVTNPQGRNARGYLIASLTRDDGEDFADWMVVYGHAARSNDWNWCGAPEDLRDQNGPNLWFPPDDRHEGAHD